MLWSYAEAMYPDDRQHQEWLVPDALDGNDEFALTSDLIRAEQADVILADRLRAARGARIRVTVPESGVLEGRLTEASAEWIELDTDSGWVLIPLHAVVMLHGLGVRARQASRTAVGEQSLRSRLRQISRDRAPVTVITAAGTVAGRLARVGADAIDLVGVDRGGEAQRRRELLTIPVSRVLAVQSLSI